MSAPSEIEEAVSAQAREWVRLLASGEIDSESMSDLMGWLGAPENARAFERERAFWQDLETHRGLFTSANDLAPQSLPTLRQGSSRLLPQRKLRVGKSAASIWGSVVAASLILAFIGPEASLRLRADHVTSASDIRTVALDDGSTLVLDSSSAVDLQFDGRERRLVLLRGRAWFDVAHGDARPFRVAAGNGITEDVGTAFEVDRTAPRSTRIAVSEGAVRVARNDTAPDTTLHAGQRARYDGSMIERLGDVRTDRVAAWRDRELLIDEQPIAEAIAEVGHYRRMPIFVLADLSGKRPVSGVFRTDRPDDAVAAIAAGAGLRLTYLPAGAILLR